MARRRGFRLSPPRKVTLLVAVVLWLIGVGLYVPGIAPVLSSAVATIPGTGALPGNLGVWALAAAGLLMFVGVTFEGI